MHHTAISVQSFLSFFFFFFGLSSLSVSSLSTLLSKTLASHKEEEFKSKTHTLYIYYRESDESE